MTKEAKAAYWREYRKAHREEYNANQRRRRRNETPERRAARLRKRREWRLNMSDDQRAHEYALQTESRNRRRESVLAYKREYWQRNKARLSAYAKQWKERNYQRVLELSREYHKMVAERAGRVYRPRISCRIPSWVTCSAQARWLAQVAYTRRVAATVGFAVAIQSGLTVGRFSK